MASHPNVSSTATGLSDSVFSRLAARAKEMSGDITPLHVGDTYLEPPACAQSETLSTTDHPGLHQYAPVRGTRQLLDAICQRIEARHQRTVPANQIQVVSGATSGISIVCQTLLDPGDEVLLPSPFWPLVRGIIRARGAVAVEIPIMHRLQEAELDIEAELSKKLSDKTRALYINTPHNPTGTLLSPEQIRTMLHFAHKHNLWVIADEAYQDLYFGDLPPKATWTYEEARGRTIACHTLSKSYGLAGARIGYIHSDNKDALRAIRGVQTFQTYCAPKPMQTLGAKALLEGNDWTKRALEGYRACAQTIADTLSIPMAQGGTFLFFDASKYMPETGQEGALPFLERALEKTRILFTPGSACGTDFHDWVRVCFSSAPHEKVAAAMARFKAEFNV